MIVAFAGEGRTNSTGGGSSRGDGNKRSGGGAGGVKRPLPRDEDEDVVLLDSEIDGSAPAGRTSGDDHTHTPWVPPRQEHPIPVHQLPRPRPPPPSTSSTITSLPQQCPPQLPPLPMFAYLCVSRVPS